MKKLVDVTLYDLMAEDIEVWVSVNKEFGFNLEVDDENGDELVRETGVHPYAASSFADFCRGYLNAYEQATKSEVA